MNLLDSARDFLIAEDPPDKCDLIFVLAGRLERKPYGLELYRQQLAPRLILSVGRFEVRQTAALLDLPGLVTLRDTLVPSRRHFWVELSNEKPTIRQANLKRANTFGELEGLAVHLGEGAAPDNIAIVSTSIHLSRVRFCCSRMPFFKQRKVRFLPVPEAQSSFRRDDWWKHSDHWHYVLSEYIKLGGYHLVY